MKKIIFVLTFLLTSPFAQAKDSSFNSTPLPSTTKPFYGWLEGVNASKQIKHIAKSIPIEHTESYINIDVIGISRTVGREARCNAIYLDQPVVEIKGIPVTNNATKTTQEISREYRKHRGTFIRLNNVKTYSRNYKTVCVASSAETMQKTEKQDVEFKAVNNAYIKNILSIATHASKGPSKLNAINKPRGRQWALITPDEYDCTQYQWSKPEFAKKSTEEIQKNNLHKLTQANVTYVGVTPSLNLSGRCDFDSIIISESE